MIRLLNENISQEEKDRLWSEIIDAPHWEQGYNFSGFDCQRDYDIWSDNIDTMLQDYLAEQLPSFRKDTVSLTGNGLQQFIEDMITDTRDPHDGFICLDFDEPLNRFWKSSDPDTQYIIDCLNVSWVDAFWTDGARDQTGRWVEGACDSATLYPFFIAHKA